MGKKIAILQSNYIPWKGYFDLIASVDEFILYDDMQYTRRDWRNRNKIKTPNGAQWLTVPVKTKGNYHQKIKDVEIEPSNWREQHWKNLVQNYRKANCFNRWVAGSHAAFFHDEKSCQRLLNHLLEDRDSLTQIGKDGNERFLEFFRWERVLERYKHLIASMNDL